jgi:hypothetical protein
MTRDDIIRIAHKCGLCSEDGRDSDSVIIVKHLERFAKLVAAAEREACAKVCEEAHWSLDDRNEYAAAIRARGQK